MPAPMRKTTTAPPSPQRKVAGRTAGAGRTSGFSYTGRSPEDIKERAARSVGGRDSYFKPEMKYFTAREGSNTVRFLPMPTDKDWKHYGFTLYAHYDIGVDKGAFLCLAKMNGEVCPVCDERSSANSAGEDEFAKSLGWRERVPRYVIDRAHPDEGPLLWNISGGMDKDITKLEIDPSTGEVLFVDHPDEGYDFSFSRAGTGMKTKYSGYQFARAASALSDDPKEADKWLTHITEHAIDDSLVFRDADYLAKALDGQAPPKPEAADDAPPPTPAKPAGRGRAAPAAAPPPVAAKPPGRSRKPPEPPPEPDTGDDDLPTWDQLLEMDGDALSALGDEYEDFWADAPEFDDDDQLREFVATKLEIEITEPEPEPAAAPAAGPAWKSRFNKNKK